MKKILLPFVFLLVPFVTLMAQVSYSFSASTATYTPITAGTSPTLITPFVNYAKADEGYANNIPIGFPFIYNGVSYANLNVNVNGFITLGAGFVNDPDETFFENSLTAGPVSQNSARPVIAPLWDDMDLVSETNLKYELTGTAPNRVFTMEWARARWSYTATASTMSFEVKLYETSNVIEFAYKREAGAAVEASASIGISALLTGAGNFLSLNNTSAAPVANSTTENDSLATRPATNQVYRFTPLSCIAPSVTSLTNVTSTSLTFSWNAISGVSGYEYASSTSAIPPASGTVTTATSVNISGLNPAANNYLYVRSVCSPGVFSTWSQRAIVLCTPNTAPVNGATTNRNPTISWSALPGATAYTIMFSTNGTTYINIGSLPATATSATITNLNYNSTYFFYIRPVIKSDTASVACASNATSFKVGAPPVITCTTNKTPDNAAKNVSPAATITSWNAVSGATAYAIMLSVDGGTTYENIGTTVDTTINLGGAGIIDYNTTYYYYIRAIIDSDTASTSCVSTATYFKTSVAPAVPANDDCEAAITMGLTPVNATTLGATEYLAAAICNGFTGNANDDVWFKFSALFNGTANIILTNAGKGLDAVLEGYRGTCGSFVALGCADNTFDGENETLALNNLVAGQTYYFRVYGYNDNVDGGTFTVQVNGSALPIVLSNFSGQQTAGRNLLTWTTQAEQNSKGFELERSADGTNFSALSFLNTKATNGVSTSALQYQYTDAKPFSSSNYYRLKQIDRDGSFKYSNVVLLKGSRPLMLQMSVIYPNPVSSVLNVLITSPVNNNVKFIISDATGKLLKQLNEQIIAGDNTFRLSVSGLAAGSYFVKAVCANGCETTVQKFVKK